MTAAPASPRRPRTLRELVEALGVAADEIDRAEADGTLGLLALDHLALPEPALFTLDEIGELSGLGDEVSHIWRALGFPDPGPSERVFTEVDLDLLKQVESFLSARLVEREGVLQMARVIGSSTARIASAQIDALEAAVDDPADFEHGDPAVLRASLVLPLLPRVMDHTWRRHLQIAARRRLVREAGAAAGGGGAPVAVGFADLVGFTALSQRLSDRDLDETVDRFETVAYEIIASRGGRVVKTIGDEVMFAAEDLSVAVDIALALAEAYREDEALSDVRVGLAWGPVLEREGDLFGPTVNLASRIVSIAFAASVVVPADVYEALAEEKGLAWRQLRTRNLKHIGRVRLWAVRRADDDFEREGLRERARRSRMAVVDRVTDLLERADKEPDDSGEDER